MCAADTPSPTSLSPPVNQPALWHQNSDDANIGPDKHFITGPMPSADHPPERSHMHVMEPPDRTLSSIDIMNRHTNSLDQRDGHMNSFDMPDRPLNGLNLPDNLHQLQFAPGKDVFSNSILPRKSEKNDPTSMKGEIIEECLLCDCNNIASTAWHAMVIGCISRVTVVVKREVKLKLLIFPFI